MRTVAIPEQRSSLQEVEREFEIWRSRSKNRRRIPSELWDAAVKLCEDYSVSKVATTLRLNHTDLKNRKGTFPGRQSQQGPSSFIELSIPPTKADPSEWMLELEDTNGRKMRLSWKGGRGPDVSSLAKGFWEIPG